MHRRKKLNLVKLMKIDIHAPSISYAHSSRVDDTHPDHPQGGHTGYEEIVSAAGLHELRNSLDNERRIVCFRIRWDHKLGLRTVRAPSGRMVADDWAGVIARASVKSVVDPLLLYEFKLPKQTRAQDQHDDAVLGRIGNGGRRVAVWQPAPDDTTTIV